MAKIGINTGTAADSGDGSSLRSGGGIINSNFDEIYSYFGDGSNLTFSGGDWGINDTGITTTSNVGVGTTTASTVLTVVGDVNISGATTASAFRKAGGTSSQFLKADGNVDSTSYLSANSDGSGLTGVVTTTTFDGSGLTGIVTTIVAGSNVSVSGATGAVTINAAGGGGGGGAGLWESNSSGIHTMTSVGIGTPTAASPLTVKGDSAFTGNLTVSGIHTVGTALSLGDGVYAHFGNDSDLRIYHSGGDSYIEEIGLGGSLVLRSDNFLRLQSQTGDEDYIECNQDGAVRLFYDDAEKFTTTGTGAIVTGVLTATTYKGAIAATEGTFSGVCTSSVGFATDAGTSSQFLKADGSVDNSAYIPTYTETDTLQNVCSRGTTTSTDITSTGTVEAGTLVKTGGTSSQFLKADGSVDSNTYLQTVTLPSRTSVATTTSTLTSGSSEDILIVGYKSYALLKVEVNYASWVVLYVDAASRTADSSRAEGTDPQPGSGVIAETLTSTSGSSTFLFSPGTLGWNNNSTPDTNIYAKVKNKESGSVAVTVTLTILKLED